MNMPHHHHEPRVLILGGFGRVGLEAARYLIEETDASLVLCSRAAREIPAWMKKSAAHRVQAQVLDVENISALETACAQVQVVLSCVGPSGQVGDRVARTCKRVGTPLVDAGGYDPLLRSLEQAEKDTPSGVPLVINVGLLPGLSGLFPHWLIQDRCAGRKLEQLDVHYVGRDAWTYNSAWDIIHSLGGFGEDRGFCYLQNMRVVRVSMRQASRKVLFPAPIGRASTMLIYAEEIARLARQHGIGIARVYGANIGPRATLVCMLAKVLRFYRSARGIDRGARWLVEASARDMRKLAPVYGMRVDLRYQDGTADSAALTLADTYRATGAVIGTTARCLLEGEGPGPGVFMLHEAVVADRFMRQLEKLALVRIQHEESEPSVATAGMSV